MYWQTNLAPVALRPYSQQGQVTDAFFKELPEEEFNAWEA